MNRRINPAWLACGFLAVWAVGSAAALAAGEPIEQWGTYEIELKGPAAGNPFTDIEVSATFSQKGERTTKVPGFYDGDGAYRVRFMPTEQGTWWYETTSSVAEPQPAVCTARS